MGRMAVRRPVEFARRGPIGAVPHQQRGGHRRRVLHVLRQFRDGRRVAKVFGALFSVAVIAVDESDLVQGRTVHTHSFLLIGIGVDRWRLLSIE